MFRLVEASRFFREAVPAELVPVVWVVTALGSAKTLVVALSLGYWNLDDHRDAVLSVVSVAFCALAVTLALKHGFDLPRPPERVRRYPVETSAVGFPSGHAIAATTVYGGVLLAFKRHRDPRAVAGVAALVVAISLSRVVLGVHYLGDVVAGVGVGLVVLGASTVVFERGAVYGFAAAAALSVPALVVSDGTADAVFALGGSLGGLAGAVVRSPVPRFRTVTERLAVSAGGGALVVCVTAVRSVVENAFLVAGATALLVMCIVVVPTVTDKLRTLDPPSRTNY